MTIQELREKLNALTTKAATIQSQADTENRALTQGEQKEFDSAMAEYEATDADIKRREKLGEIQNRLAQPQPRAVQAAGFEPPVSLQGNWGFKNSTDFYAKLIRDPRAVQAAVSTYANDTTNADGLYALPPDFRAGIMTLVNGPTSLLPRVDSVYTTSNGITLPIDEETPWAATGINPTGPVAEGVAFGQTKPVLKSLAISLVKYGGIVSVTEEMLEDGTQIGPFVQKKAGDKLSQVINSAIVTSMTGAGSKISVAKQSAEAVGAAPAIATIQKMWVTLFSQFRGNAVWLANPVLETAFMNYTIGNMPVYLPAGGLSGAPLSTLFGKPVIFLEGLAAQGVTGSLVLADPSSIYGVQKTQGVRTDVTPYFAWDQDMTSYKVAVRAAFKSKLSAAITRADATTASNVVAHATF